MNKSFVFLLIMILPLFAFTQQKKAPPKTRILFVMDGSQSMLTKWESGTKMVVAQQLLSEIVDSLKRLNHVEMALRVYGHQKPVPPQDCNDTKLEVPFSKNNANKIKNKLRSIRPKGTTPIAHSLEMSASDFPKCSDCRNIIILITDGIESCEGDPCAVSLSLQKQGIILKPFVIGIGLDEKFKETFDCVGRYYDANDETRFKEVLNVVVNQVLNSTSLQVNLLDENDEPTESNVNMSFYDEFSGELHYNFVHTLNRKGNPDTLSVDPVPVYKIQIHTLPSLTIREVEITASQHNTVSIKAPQGQLRVKTSKPNNKESLQFIVRQKNAVDILNVQPVNQLQAYLIGEYTVEILTLPRLKIDDVQVEPGEISDIIIPQPGLVTFVSSAPGFATLYKKEGNQWVLIAHLDPESSNQTYNMQPGNYIVVSRPRNAISSAYTSTKNFSVKSGLPTKVVLY